MDNSNAVTTIDPRWAAFKKQQADAAAQTSKPRPDDLKLNGNTGAFTLSKWNPEKKERESTDVGNNVTGVILTSRYLVKWKYADNARFAVMSREFDTFNAPLTLLKYDNTDRKKAPEEKAYQSYYDLKQKCGTTDAITGKESYPFDLYVSLYVLVDGKVVNYRIKGDTRSNWFDYNNENPAPMIVMTRLACEEKVMGQRDGGKGDRKAYYAGTFENVGDVSGDLTGKVIDALEELVAWFQHWDNTRKSDPKANAPQIVAPAPAQIAPVERDEVDEIRVEDIPF